MWEKMTARIEEMGGEVRLQTPVTKIELDGQRVKALHIGDEVIEPQAVISSLPLRDTVKMADPAAPRDVVKAGAGLRYRDFLTVALVLDGEDPFPDNWIYIHEPDVEVGRIQNFRSWSPWMVPDPDTGCVGMEYFCFQGDRLWNMADEDLVALATRELEHLGLAKPGQVKRGYAVRVPLAYPMYDESYAAQVETIRTWLDPIQGLVQVGRNGLHRYNNSDHSMLSAMRAVDNVLGRGDHDIWAVNVESAYHEEQTDADAEHAYKKVPVTPAMEAEERAMAEAA
jgi:protoporphyrinogen oxidase